MRNGVVNNRQSGFTIVELVVVIILLGILAATALPRFIDLDDEANAAAFEGVVGGFQTGLSLYHAQWFADQEPPAGTQLLEFGNLRTNGQGFPYSTTSRTGHVITNHADCSAVFTNLLQGGPTISDQGSPALARDATSDYWARRISNTQCDYVYTGQSTVQGQTVPMMSYNATNGVLTRGTYTIP